MNNKNAYEEIRELVDDINSRLRILDELSKKVSGEIEFIEAEQSVETIDSLSSRPIRVLGFREPPKIKVFIKSSIE